VAQIMLNLQIEKSIYNPRIGSIEYIEIRTRSIIFVR